MRRKTWYPANLGDKRISNWFAFLPVRLGNDFRWLEFVTVEWEYCEVNAFFPPCSLYPVWKKIRFIEDKV